MSPTNSPDDGAGFQAIVNLVGSLVLGILGVRLGMHTGEGGYEPARRTNPVAGLSAKRRPRTANPHLRANRRRRAKTNWPAPPSSAASSEPAITASSSLQTGPSSNTFRSSSKSSTAPKKSSTFVHGPLRRNHGRRNADAGARGRPDVSPAIRRPSPTASVSPPPSNRFPRFPTSSPGVT